MWYLTTWFPGWQENKSLIKGVAFPLGILFNENNEAKLVFDNEEVAIRRRSSK